MDPMNQELPERLAGAMRALEAQAAQRAARVSVERVAAGVVERLRREGRLERRVWWRTPTALRAAAAVVLLAAAGWTAVRLREGARPARLPLPVIAMDSLSTGQLESVLEAAGHVRAANFGPLAPSNGSLDSLSEQQLQKVLASL